jgi:hypothetical protein
MILVLRTSRELGMNARAPVFRGIMVQRDRLSENQKTHTFHQVERQIPLCEMLSSTA